MRFVEIRIPMPFSVEKHEIGSRYTTSKMRLLETGANKGVEIVIPPEPRQDPDLGNVLYEHSILHLSDQIPRTIRMLSPKGSPEVHIKRHTNYPEVRSEYTNHYMKDAFHIRTQETSIAGKEENNNALLLDEEKVSARRVIAIDILNPRISDENKLLTPNLEKIIPDARQKSLATDWLSTESETMINYQFSEINFKWFGLQERVESILEKTFVRINSIYYRRMYYWIDEWYNMTISDIEKYEETIKEELDKKRNSAEFTGLRVK